MCIRDSLKDATPLSSEQEEAMLARGGRMAFLVAERMGVRGVPVLYELLRTSSGLTRLRAALALASHGEADVASRSILSAAVTSGTLLPKVLEALAEVGTVEEVPKLSPIAEAWTHPQRHAAKKAIRSIQSRIRGAGAGQLALAESQGGEVSVAEAPSRAGAATRRPQHEG